jgi:hypothetical protein
MRVRHRWLLLSIFVAATLVVPVILGSRRTDHSLVTISFLAYTNLPNVKVRSAVFFLKNDHPASVLLSNWCLEAEGLEDHKVNMIQEHLEIIPLHTVGPGEPWSFKVDEPKVSGRWRISCRLCRLDLRSSLVLCAGIHGLLPRTWVNLLWDGRTVPSPSKRITSTSIWLTNSP